MSSYFGDGSGLKLMDDELTVVFLCREFRDSLIFFHCFWSEVTASCDALSSRALRDCGAEQSFGLFFLLALCWSRLSMQMAGDEPCMELVFGELASVLDEKLSPLLGSLIICFGNA
jgi:hypothetical protein